MENDRDYGESDPDVGNGEPVLGRTEVKIVLFLLSCAVTMIIIVVIINGNSGSIYQFSVLSHDHHFINTHALLLFS